MNSPKQHLCIDVAMRSSSLSSSSCTEHPKPSTRKRAAVVSGKRAVFSSNRTPCDINGNTCQSPRAQSLRRQPAPSPSSIKGASARRETSSRIATRCDSTCLSNDVTAASLFHSGLAGRSGTKSTVGFCAFALGGNLGSLNCASAFSIRVNDDADAARIFLNATSCCCKVARLNRA